MNWEREYITKWNCYRFPLNTKKGQIRKVEGEVREYNEAKERTDKLEELADIYIASAGLARFSVLGTFICRMFEALPQFAELQPFIDAKMEINNNRKFDENMQHIEEKNEDVKKPLSGVIPREYVKVERTINIWKQDNSGNWRCEKVPFEYQELKREA